MINGRFNRQKPFEFGGKNGVFTKENGGQLMTVIVIKRKFYKNLQIFRILFKIWQLEPNFIKFLVFFSMSNRASIKI